MNIHWAGTEIDYLITNAPKMTAKQLSAELDCRSVGAVLYKLRKFGISAKRGSGRCGVNDGSMRGLYDE